jgi:tetratricopeptide (TPR) repeat protein
LFLLLNKQGKVRNTNELNHFKEIIDNTLLKNEGKAQSHETKYLFNHIYSAFYFGTGDYKGSYRFLKKNVELIESSTEYFKEEPNIYFSMLTNLIYVSSQLKKYDEVFSLMKKLKSIPETFATRRNEDLEIKLFSSAMSIEITLYNSLGEFEKAIQLVPKIETGLERFDEKLSKLRKAYFYFNIAVANFGAEKFTNALRWTNKFFNESQIDEGQDIYCFTQLLNMIIHIELKNDDIVPYIFKSTYRYLKTRNRVYKFENVFLEFIERLMKTQKPEEQLKHYKILREELIRLSKDSFEKTAFEYFDFISWVESKIGKSSFRKIVEAKAKK